MSNTYWQKRLLETQNNLTKKNIKQTEKQLRKYYSSAMKRVIADFERVYDKLLNLAEQGKTPSPADLYKLDAYWEMQGQLRRELQKLGDRQVQLLSKQFEINFFEVYYSIAIPGKTAFSTIDKAGALQMINSSWLADGKNFSQRIWNNTDQLVETLNENLIHCVTTGKKTTELKNILQERFGVSYNRADALVHTEMANIQTQAAKRRYQDYGLTHYEFLADTDERTCSVCSKLDGKKFLYTEMQPGVNAPPMHPKDRCTIVPVVE